MKHPCFDCTLPACNDQDKKCQLRRGEHAYQRARYHKQYYQREWNDASNYHLVVNTGKVGVDGAVELVQRLRELVKG